MKKTLLSLAIALTLISGVAQTATLVAGYDYTINILADGNSCFAADKNCVGNALTALVDNDGDFFAASGSANPDFGSSVAGDGLAGFINILTTDDGAGGVNFTVTSFNMDTYVNTIGGFFATQAADTSGMSGSIDAFGNISFDPTGRTSMLQFFNTSLGELPWNTGSTFTSGNQVNADADLNGIALQLDGTATIISASEFGPAWQFFADVSYTEVFSLQIVGGTIIDSPAVVPVPAAVWLFGSGLFVLVGAARRKSIYQINGRSMGSDSN